MRLATYNVEWFDALFDDQGRLYMDAEPSARHGVSRAEQARALGRVFAELDADAVLVVEAPDTNARRDTTRALTYFATAFDLRCRAVLTGFTNDTQQELALLYDPAVLNLRHDPQAGPDAPRFDGVFRIDLDIDATEDRVTFSKPPLEVEAVTPGGRVLRLIGAHLKSKAPHGAVGADRIMRLSIANRRKQLAQAIWIRRRIDAALAAGDSVILLGDLNDGPGLDEYEHLFGRSSVEILLGEAAPLYDPHALEALKGGLAPQPTSARFYIGPERRYLQAMLDYIMVSQDLRPQAKAWRIWHPFDDPDCWDSPDLRAALLAASDHFPVTVDLDI